MILLYILIFTAFASLNNQVLRSYHTIVNRISMDYMLQPTPFLFLNCPGQMTIMAALCLKKFLLHYLNTMLVLNIPRNIKSFS